MPNHTKTYKDYKPFAEEEIWTPKKENPLAIILFIVVFAAFITALAIVY